MRKIKSLSIIVLTIICCLLFTACPPQNDNRDVAYNIYEISHYELKIDNIDYSLKPNGVIINDESEASKYLSREQFDYSNIDFSCRTLYIVALMEKSVPDQYTPIQLHYEGVNNGQYAIVNNILNLDRSIDYSNTYHYVTVFLTIDRISSNLIIDINLTDVNAQTSGNEEMTKYNELIKDKIINADYSLENIPLNKIFTLSDLEAVKNENEVDKLVRLSFSDIVNSRYHLYIKTDKLDIVNNIDIDEKYFNNDYSTHYYWSGTQNIIYQINYSVKNNLISKEDIMVLHEDEMSSNEYTIVAYINCVDYVVRDLNDNIISCGIIVYSNFTNYQNNSDYFYFNTLDLLVYNSFNIENMKVLTQLDIYYIVRLKSLPITVYVDVDEVGIIIPVHTSWEGTDLLKIFDGSKIMDMTCHFEYWRFKYDDIISLVYNKNDGR